MHSKLFRLCSMLLAIVMLCNMLPLTTFAEIIEIGTTNNAVEPSHEATRIVGEVETLRTVTQKHFRMSDGSFLAVNYGVPVHYQNTSGEWQEIDNRLAVSADGNAYAARNGDAVTAYAADLSTGHILTTAYGDVSVSMGILDGSQAQTMSDGQMDMAAQPVTYDRNACAVLTQQEKVESAAFSAGNNSQGWTTEDLIPAGLNASVLYEDVFPGIDLQYTAYSHHIKEQIIVKEPQTSYRYDFSLSLEGLSAELNEDGSVTLADENGNGIYTIPAPYMEDDAGSVSTDVSYTIAAASDGIILTVTADNEWINDEARVLPVRIDPTLLLETGYTNQDIYTSFAMEAAPNATSLNWSTLYVGNYPYEPENLQGLYRLFVHFNHLPSIPSGSIITEAEFGMRLSEYSGRGVSEIALAAYDVTTELPADYSNHREWFKAITWRNQPQYNTDNAYDYVSENTTLGYHFWDLTEAAKHWYFESSDPTIAIVAEDETMLTVANYRYAGFNVFGSGTPPLFCITYRSDVGLEDYYSYTSMSAGRAGTGYINNYTGNLVWVRSDMGFGGNRMPVSISHVYNANSATINTGTDEDEEINFGLGHGWRTNFNQRVSSVTINGAPYYAWEDADGTVHYFYNDSGTYRDEDGLDLTMTVSDGYTIEDKYGNKSYFDTAGRLTKQENNQATKSSITITHRIENGKEFYINTVIDGAGRVYQFQYADNNLLEKISYLGSDSSERYCTNYNYTDANLTEVTDEDGNSSHYDYDSNHLLISATDVDGYKLTYGYQTTATGKNSRVVSVAEHDGTVAGGTLAIEYAHNQTTFTDYSGNVQIMQFNNWGNLISVQDGEGRAQYAAYGWTDTRSEGAGKGNQLTMSSKLQNTVGNALDDSSFERSTLWTVTSSAVSRAIASGTAYHGSKSLKLTRSAAGTAAGVYSGSITVAAGETFTFSAYVKTGSGMTAYLTLTDGSTTKTSETLAANSGWTRLEVTYTNNTSSSKSVTARFMTTTAGTAYMDCVQVEKAPTASRYNLVENGDFRYTSNWSSTEGRTTLSPIAAPQLSSNVYKITGNPLQANRITQTVNVSGDGGDCYVLSGWAKGDSVPLWGDAHSVPQSGVHREFSIIGTFNYTDGSTKDFTARFNPDTDSSAHWQYSSAAMVAESAYSSITVTVAYDYNVNTVYFDGIQLYKEEFCTSYTYENGNVISVKDLQGQTATYEYENNDLTKQLHPSGVGMRYEYDEWHNVITAVEIVKNEDGEEIDGIVYNFTYDTYGNNTSVSVGNGITTTATYNNSGNTLHQTTDALGNVTTYSYDANTNVLDWVRYPKDTDVTRTKYTYDDMYRIETMAARIDENTNLTANYTYTDDLLTKLQTGSTTYSFNYGNFDLRSNIKIGSRTLASYSYTNRTNYLSSLDYGNGDKVQYTYDKQGRVTKQTYEDGDTVTYKYDNSGALATVTDSATGITTTYYYDFTDRLMKYVESGSNYSHSVGYRYDTLNNLTALVETINGTERTTSYSYNDDNRIASITDSGADKNSSDDDISESYTYDSYGRIHTKVTSNGGTAILTETYTYKENASDKPTNQVWKLTSEYGNETVVYEYSYDSNGNITAVEKTVGDTHTNTSYVYDSANQLIRENDQAANVTWVYTYDNAGNLLTKLQYPYSEGTLGSRIRTYTLGYTDSEWGDLQTHWCGGAFTYDAIGNLTHAGSFDYTWEHGRQLATMYGENVSGGNNDMTVDFTYDADGMRTGKVITKNNYHVHSYAETITAPTCIAGGHTTYTCACGTTYTGAETPALGHDLTGVGVEDGVLYTCSRCDYSALEDHTHSYRLNVVWPTCTESGYTSHTCDECGYSYTDNIRAPLGHQFNDQSICIRCGIEEIPIPPIIRPPVNPPIASGIGDGETSAYALNSDETPILVSTEITTYSYIYNGGSLSQMQVTAAVTADGETTTTTHTLDFTYDASGGPVSVTYDGTAYFYATNLQGDVTAILNSSGTAVVDYTYSAWGSITSTNGSMKDTLGFYNPLRYRGYVYDQELGLYYLQSRYYNPGLGRFNAPDAFTSTGQGLLGDNMYAYCNNNPVNRADYTGTAGLPVPTLGDYYGMHKAVQYDIAEERGYGMEVPVTGPRGVGRLDLYDGTTNTYYEVKHFLAAEGKALERQMKKYDCSHVTGWRFDEYQIYDNVSKGKERFLGSTQYLYWDIYYVCTGNGLVTYTWEVNASRYAEFLAMAAAVTITAGVCNYAFGGATQGATRKHFQ